MENPYGSPSEATPPPAVQRFRWGRVLAWAALIYAATMAVGFASGLSMAHWEIYGDTIDRAVENARLVRRIASGGVGAILYWRLAAGVQPKGCI